VQGIDENAIPLPPTQKQHAYLSKIQAMLLKGIRPDIAAVAEAVGVRESSARQVLANLSRRGLVVCGEEWREFAWTHYTGKRIVQGRMYLVVDSVHDWRRPLKTFVPRGPMSRREIQELELLELICGYFDQGSVPSLRQLAKRLGRVPSTILLILTGMKEKGMVASIETSGARTTFLPLMRPVPDPQPKPSKSGPLVGPFKPPKPDFSLFKQQRI